MNCLDYRRALLTGEGETEGMHAHRMQCAACGALFSEHNAFENELRRALEVPVPAELKDRLLEAVQEGGYPAPALRARRRRFLAATAVAVGAAGVGLYAWIGRNDPLAMASIDFVMKEEAKSIRNGSVGIVGTNHALVESVVGALRS